MWFKVLIYLRGSNTAIRRIEMNERIISSGDAEICTEAFGNPDNPALLLVIGASASMLRWDEQLIERFTAA